MADYFTPTVVQPSIPKSDMTPLERFLLARIFDMEDEDECVYLSAEVSPNETLEVPLGELKAALAASAGVEGAVATYIAKAIADWDGVGDDEDVWLDLTASSYECILQDIVKRSPVLTRIEVVSSFTCSKMRPDGFGGMALVITAEAIRGKSTQDILNDFLSEDEFGSPAVEAGFGVHALVSLSETAVRTQLSGIIESDDGISLTAADVTASEVREACKQVVQASDLNEERGFAEYKAAVLAIRLAEERKAAA